MIPTQTVLLIFARRARINLRSPRIKEIDQILKECVVFKFTEPGEDVFTEALSFFLGVLNFQYELLQDLNAHDRPALMCFRTVTKIE